MAELYGLVECTLCSKAFKKYDRKQNSQIYGVSLGNTNKGLITMVDNDKSEIDKHICVYCINNIVKQFGL